MRHHVQTEPDPEIRSLANEAMPLYTATCNKSRARRELSAVLALPYSAILRGRVSRQSRLILSLTGTSHDRVSNNHFMGLKIGDGEIMLRRIYLQRTCLALALALLSSSVALAQATSFTYQGRLNDGGAPANGNYDLQFALFDSLSGGTQIGTTQSNPNVAVSGGIFTVQLNFGASAFPGATRFLEISARLSGAASLTTLSPRQQITSTPYAIRSLSASSADAVTVNGVPSGSGNYIQNATTPQAGANFNISGNGTAVGTLSGNVVNATTQYNFNGSHALSVDFDNLSFFVGSPKPANSTGSYNYFSTVAGGVQNTTGSENSFFGVLVGNSNSVGSKNSFFGTKAGQANTQGDGNAFFGDSSGGENSTGSENSFLGNLSGGINTTGIGNTALGSNTKIAGAGNLANATAIGFRAQVDQSNTIVLGSVAGVNGAANSVNVGIGTTAPQNTLHVKGGVLVETSGSGGNLQLATPNSETGMTIAKGTSSRVDMRFDGSALKLVATAGSPVGIPPPTNGIAISTSGNVGVGTTTPSAKFEIKGPGAIDVLRVSNSSGLSGLVVRDDRIVAIGQLSSLEAASTHVCADSFLRLSFCTSSLRYKDQVKPYRAGLDLIRQLQPISFNWKGTAARDFGLGAEDVARVEPLLVTHNDKGEIQGVKYEQLNVVLINAVKQQQAQIETLQAANNALNERLRSVEKVMRKRVGLSRQRRR